jgi:hypothetical protein
MFCMRSHLCHRRRSKATSREEAHGQLRDDETAEEKEIAKKQEKLEESHPHHMQPIFS